jgi:hypothetical protein
VPRATDHEIHGTLLVQLGAGFIDVFADDNITVIDMFIFVATGYFAELLFRKFDIARVCRLREIVSGYALCIHCRVHGFLLVVLTT